MSHDINKITFLEMLILCKNITKLTLYVQKNKLSSSLTNRKCIKTDGCQSICLYFLLYDENILVYSHQNIYAISVCNVNFIEKFYLTSYRVDCDKLSNTFIHHICSNTRSLIKMPFQFYGFLTYYSLLTHTIDFCY